MTSDEEKDPPVPSYLEGISLHRTHDGQVVKEHDTKDVDSPPLDGPDE